MTVSTISQFWDSAIVPTLVDYNRIPAKPPHFDRDGAQFEHVEMMASKGAENVA